MNINLKQNVKKILAKTELINPFNSLFKELEFETLSYCNRKCAYCPNSSWERLGEHNHFFMAEEVFRTLIKQLTDLGFAGQIAPHLYGEPMSDPRLLNWVSHTREQLPNCRIKVVTNGDFLNRKSYVKMLNAGVDVIFISKHSNQLKKACRELLASLTQKETADHIVLQDYFSEYEGAQEGFTNRGGDIDLDNNSQKKPPVNCTYATYPVINTFGDLIICCQDFHSKYVFGNIMKRHLKDIWYDEYNINLRKRIFKSNFDLDICKNCLM